MAFVDWSQVKEEAIAPGIRRQLVTGERMMFVRWRFDKGFHVPPHEHPNEQIAYMVSGRMEFRLGAERRTVGPGEVCVVPGNTEHEAWFEEATEVIDVFSPPRQDFLEGREEYLRRGAAELRRRSPA